MGISVSFLSCGYCHFLTIPLSQGDREESAYQVYVNGQVLQGVTQKGKHVLYLVLKFFGVVHLIFDHFGFNVLGARAACVMACGRTNRGSLSLIWQAWSQNDCRGRGLC